ncbi:MAG: hypothetical protein ACYTEI_04575 [Planctomycetota bacterium]
MRDATHDSLRSRDADGRVLRPMACAVQKHMTDIVEHPLYNEWDDLRRRERMDLKAA